MGPQPQRQCQQREHAMHALVHQLWQLCGQGGSCLPPARSKATPGPQVRREKDPALHRSKVKPPAGNSSHPVAYHDQAESWRHCKGRDWDSLGTGGRSLLPPEQHSCLLFTSCRSHCAGMVTSGKCNPWPCHCLAGLPGGAAHLPGMGTTLIQPLETCQRPGGSCFLMENCQCLCKHSPASSQQVTPPPPPPAR